ncbi:MAG: VOC family protein [Opitutaceae bacterium]|nr:VOC family protein [Opitutaceae bacterium]
MIKQLAHLCLKTSQLPRLTEFYRDALGATVKFRYLNRAGEPVGCYFAFGGNTFIEVFDHADAHRRSASAKTLESLEEPRDPWLMRYNHFCLQVEGLDAYVAQLESRGVTVAGRKTGHDRSRQAWIKDPDGNLIELQEYTPQSRQFTGEDFREG